MKIARTFLLLLLTVRAFAAAPGEDRVVAWVRAFNSGSFETMEAFARDNYLPGLLQKRSPDERKAMFERLSNAHGKLTVTGIEMADGELRVEVQPERGGEALTLSFRIEPEAPHRIAGMGIDIGGGRGERVQLPPITEPLDAYFAALAAQDRFSGAVLVAKNGEVQFEKAYGLASRRYDVPNKITTRFNVGSITKDFTRVAIGQLAQAGKLQLDVPIVNYLPNYPNAEVAKRITVQQLIDHTSGLGDVFTPRFWETNVLRYRTLQSYLDFFAADPLQFEPGKGQSYSNYGYVVLGAIIEAISGENYYDYIRKHVFDAAGMSGSGFFDINQIVPDLAMGHTHRAPNGESREWLENGPIRPGPRGIPAGGSYSTVRDLFVFDRALRAGKLLDAKWTRWWFGGEPGAIVDAGGSPGVNGAIASNPTWTVIVLTNIDPPVGETLAEQLLRFVSR